MADYLRQFVRPNQQFGDEQKVLRRALVQMIEDYKEIGDQAIVRYFHPSHVIGAQGTDRPWLKLQYGFRKLRGNKPLITTAGKLAQRTDQLYYPLLNQRLLL